MALQTKVISSATTSNDYTLKLTLTENSVSTSNNTSSLSWALTLHSGSWNFSQYSIGWRVIINGTTVSIQDRSTAPQRTLGLNSSITIASGTTTVTHSSDGTKTMSASANIYMEKVSYTPGDMSLSGTMTLTPIARASVPTVNTTSSGSTVVSTSPVLTKVYIQSHTASSTFKHTVKYAIAGLTNQTAGLDADATTGFTNWTSLTPPLSLLNKLTSYSGDRATLTITLNTYTDSTLSTLIGSKDTTFTLTGTGYVSIDNGSSFDNYIAFVDNGSSWDRVVPYIDNGSSWDLY